MDMMSLLDFMKADPVYCYEVYNMSVTELEELINILMTPPALFKVDFYRRSFTTEPTAKKHAKSFTSLQDCVAIFVGKLTTGSRHSKLYFDLRLD